MVWSHLYESSRTNIMFGQWKPYKFKRVQKTYISFMKQQQSIYRHESIGSPCKLKQSFIYTKNSHSLSQKNLEHKIDASIHLMARAKHISDRLCYECFLASKHAPTCFIGKFSIATFQWECAWVRRIKHTRNKEKMIAMQFK